MKRKLGSMGLSLLLALCLCMPALSSLAEATDASALEPVELTWYFMGNYPQEGQEEVFEAANKIIKEKINATVNFKACSFGDYDQKMQVVIASGEEYDICFTSNWTNNYVQNVSKGAFLPLDDLIATYAPVSSSAVPDMMWDATRINGQIYGFINQQISARTPNMNSVGRVYDANKDTLDLKDYQGKIYADTLYQLEPYIQKGIEVLGSGAYFTTNLYSLEGSFFGMDFLSSWNIPGAVALDDENMTVVNQFKSEKMLTWVQLMREWNQKGYLNAEERISRRTDDAIEGTAQKTVLYLGATYKPGVEVQDSAAAGEPVVSLPAGEPYLTTGAILADMAAISATSRNPERAMMLIELVNTDAELFNTLIAGIEGKNWVRNADGLLEKINGGYSPNSDWMFGTNFLAYVQVGQPVDIWDRTREINATAKASPMLGFTFDPESVKNEISQCSAVADEYSRGIELGVYDEAKYNEFLDKMDTAGADRIIEEMQKQVNAWKASK